MRPGADIIFTNGSVVTVDDGDRIFEAVAVVGNRISHIGNSKDVEKSAGPDTEIIDLAGRSLLPGFVDAHCHPGSYGAGKRYIPCSAKDIGSIEDMKKAVSERAKTVPKEEWIVGRGYNHE